MTATRCLCPGDCNCRYTGAPWHRLSYCGCKQHPETEPNDGAELRSRLGAGADFARGSRILAARIMASTARLGV